MAPSQRPSEEELMVITQAAAGVPVIVQRIDRATGALIRLEHHRDTLEFVFAELYNACFAYIRCAGFPLGHPDMPALQHQLDIDMYMTRHSAAWPWPCGGDPDTSTLLVELDVHPRFTNAFWTWVRSGSADITDFIAELKSISRAPLFVRLAPVEHQASVLVEVLSHDFKQWLNARNAGPTK